VLAEDLRGILLRELRTTGDPDDKEGDSTALLAEKAETSARTINRIIRGKTATVSLALADRLLVATGHHLFEVRLVFPDGKIEWG
jgi:hypothetical protein